MLWQQKGQLTEEPFFFSLSYDCIRGFTGGSVVKNTLANARDAGLAPGPERFPGEGNGNPLQ